MTSPVHHPPFLCSLTRALFVPVATVVVLASGCTSEVITPFTTGDTCRTDAPMVDFTLDDCNGEPRTLTSLAGSKATLISIGAGWCAPCRAEQPELKRFHDKYASCGLNIVGLLFETDSVAQPATKTFCKSWEDQYQTGFPTLIDPTLDVTETCHDNKAVPINVVLDASGTVVYKTHGLLKDTEAVIQSLTGCQ